MLNAEIKKNRTQKILIVCYEKIDGCSLDSSSLSDGSQSKLDGLPFTATAGTGFNYAICCSYSYGATLSNTGSASQNITGMVNANTAYVILHKWSTYLGVQPLNYSHIDDRAISMVFTGQYETNA